MKTKTPSWEEPSQNSVDVVTYWINLWNNCNTIISFKEIIQSEIDKAVMEERKRVLEIADEMQTYVFMPGTAKLIDLSKLKEKLNVK